jgi:methionyl-tRNA formyltransferase
LICAAGKNDIAVSALRYFLDHYPDHPLCFIPNASDTGVDGWQPSLIRHATAWGVRRATLDELYEEPELRFFSLEFDKLIRVHRFTSRLLFNFHFSKLPKYRGVFTAAHPILNGESESGVTLHLMDDGIDTGDVIDVLDVPIGPDDTVRDLYFNNMAAAKALFVKNVDRLVAGDFTARSQPLWGATYYSLQSIDYAAIRLDLKKTAFEIHNQVRAFAFREFQLPKYRGWGVGRSEITEQRSSLRAGRLVEETDAYFRVSSIDNDVLLFKDYQPQLWAAAECGDLASAEAALVHITDVDQRNRNGWSALIIAAYHGQVELVRRLLAAGADPDGTNYKGTTVLMYALSRYEQARDVAGFELIAQAAQRLDAVDHTGRTLRDWIVQKGLSELLQKLPA